jgi:hypothetical protein
MFLAGNPGQKGPDGQGSSPGPAGVSFVIKVANNVDFFSLQDLQVFGD